MKKSPAADLALPYLEMLRQGNVKVTKNRRKVLERFLESDKPWTLQSLHRSLSLREDCDQSSVYRALAALCSAGLLEEFTLSGDKQTFYSLNRESPVQPHHHHHIVCEECGKVSHLDFCLPATLMGKIEDASGFRITEHNLGFKGVCAACR